MLLGKTRCHICGSSLLDLELGNLVSKRAAFQSKKWKILIQFLNKKKKTLAQQISGSVRLRKRDVKNPVCLRKRNCCGNAYEHGHFSLSRFTSYPPCGNVPETFKFDFPLPFRNTETPFFTL